MPAGARTVFPGGAPERIGDNIKPVIIYFVALEEDGQTYYGEAFSGHQLFATPNLAEVEGDAEIVSVFIHDQVDDVFLTAHPNLRMIATRSGSVDHIDLAACHARNVVVSNAPGYGDGAVAEHTFALMLALARRLRKWFVEPKDDRFSYQSVRSVELGDRTLGLIGMGPIGQRVKRMALAFDMKVIAYDVEHEAGLDRGVGFEWVSLDELLASADIISLHASLSPATYHVINKANLAKTKPGVFIINTARGALVDSTALKDALDSGDVGGAGLDILEDERILRQSAPDIIASDIIRHLRSDALAQEADDAERIRALRELMFGEALLAHPNVVFTPHVAFNSEEAINRLRRITAENIRAYLAGAPRNIVQAASV
jgi:D-lactate dehydrogenase